jgi:hypothetical protein
MAAIAETRRAASIASELLTGVGTRFAHSRRVAEQVTRTGPLLDGEWHAALCEAAWLHDIGYSPCLIVTGFHPLDGARWLKGQGWDLEVCRLVAWHTGAQVEAGMRGLADRLFAEFSPPPDLAQAALTWADLTASPEGDPCLAKDRLREILSRYPAGSVVHQAVALNRPALLEANHLIEHMLDGQGRSER